MFLVKVGVGAPVLTMENSYELCFRIQILSLDDDLQRPAACTVLSSIPHSQVDPFSVRPLNACEGSTPGKSGRRESTPRGFAVIVIPDWLQIPLMPLAVQYDPLEGRSKICASRVPGRYLICPGITHIAAEFAFSASLIGILKHDPVTNPVKISTLIN